MGEQDITVTRVDTSQDPFVDVDRLSAAILSAHRQNEYVHPRFHAEVEVARGARNGTAMIVARNPDAENLGTINVLEGAYDISKDNVVILRDMADAYDLGVGDEIVLSYVLPVPREVGEQEDEDVSVNRISRAFTVSGIALQTGLGAVQNGVLIHVDTVQEWLDLSGRVERLVIVLDQGIYNEIDVETSVFPDPDHGLRLSVHGRRRAARLLADQRQRG